MEIIICCLIGYLLGNINPSYLLGRKKGYDVRAEGSGNAGASNAFILMGVKAFAASALFDIFKSFAAFRLCQALFPGFSAAGPLAGAACILGHMYPAALQFRGGKGMASLGGVILAWNWKWFFLLLGAAALIAFATRYLCLVAPAISVVFPICYYLETGALNAALILLLPALPIFIKHKDNFSRIRRGTEMRVSFLWDKEKELRRIGKWDERAEEIMEKRGK